MARLTTARRAGFIAALAVLGALIATGYLVDAAFAAPSVPAPTITSSPSNPTTSTMATFAFSDTKSGVTFKCSRDSAAFTTCTSGIGYTGLAQGSHSFQVEAVSGTSTSSATTDVWAIVPPTPTITSPPPPNPTTSTSAVFTFTDTQNGVGFTCSLDGSAFASCASGNTYTGLTGGSHTFQVEAVVGSNPPSAAASSTWSITTPTPTIASTPTNPTNSTSATFTYTDTQAGATFKCSLDGASYSTCSSSGVTYTGLAQSTHTFAAEAQLGSGPLSSPATDSWRIDTSPPSSTITFPANSGAYNQAAWAAGCSPVGICGTASDPSGVAKVAVGVLQQSSGKYWNGSSFSSGSLVFAAASGTTSWDYPFARPADGTYSVYVQATDSLGNTTATVATTTTPGLTVAIFTIDTLPPAAPVIVEGPTNPSTDASPEFELTDAGYPSVTFSCYLDSSPVVNCTGDTDHDSDPSVQGEWQFENLTPGPHCFYVYATDEAANVGPTTSSCWTITLVPSAIAMSSGSNQATPVHTAFAAPLAAKVTDAHGTPVAGVAVTFSAPTSGPSGTFASCSGGNPTSTKCTVTTNATGIAISSVFTASTVAGGPYTVTASVSGVSTTAGFSLTNTAGAATTLSVSSGSGQSATVHATLASPLVAKVADAYGNSVSGVTVTFTAPGSGASGTFAGSVNTAVTNASGIATSATFTANTTAGSYTVSAGASGTGSVTFAETNAAKAAHAIAVSSGSGQSAAVHSAFANKLAALVTDTYGNPVSGVTVTFTAPGSGASGTFAGSANTALTNASGIAASATFTANTTAGSYSVSASVSGTGSVTFAETNAAGAAAQLVFTTQPTSGQKITAETATAFKVTVEDTYGNIETADTSTKVTLAMTVNPGGSTLSCTNTGGSGPVTVSGGVAAFTCLLNKAGTGYAVGATSNPAHGSTTTNAFNIVAGGASQLAYTAQPPASTPASSAFGMTVSIEDLYGNVVTGDTHAVALSLSTNPCGATLTGTASKAAVGGVATFSNLQITTACAGYTLKATDAPDGPLTATSNPFAITPATVSKLVFTTQPPASNPATSTFAIAVTIEDLYGNTETGDTHTVALSLTTNPCAGTLGGTTSQAAVAGVVTFSNLQIATVCTGYTLSATDIADGPVIATSSPFAVTGATASAISVFSGSPQFTTVSTAFGSPLVAKVTDSHGNPVSGVQVTFTAPASGASGNFASCSGGNPTSIRCVVTSNASGLATTSTLTANSTAGGFSVTAAATGVGTPATFSLINSVNFTISGDITPPLYPGTSQKLNLVFANPNPSPITIASGAVTVTITTTQAGCPVSPNFAAPQGLTANVTVPANSTKSLSDLGIAQANWPVVAMVETHANQDACEGAPLTLHYSAGATG
jgi:hypothetical protein